jgi:hypothetical protein
VEVRARREGRVLSCAEPAVKQSRTRWAEKPDWRPKVVGKRTQKAQPVQQVLASRSGCDVDTPALWLEARTHWRQRSATCQPCPTFRTGSGAFRFDGSRRVCRRMRPQKPPERPRNNRSRTARKWLVSAAFLTQRSTYRWAGQTRSASFRLIRGRPRGFQLFSDATDPNCKLIAYSRLQIIGRRIGRLRPGARSPETCTRSGVGLSYEGESIFRCPRVAFGVRPDIESDDEETRAAISSRLLSEPNPTLQCLPKAHANRPNG